MNTLRLLFIATMFLAASLARPADASVLQNMKVAAMGSISPSGALSLVDNGNGTFNLGIPAGTLTTTLLDTTNANNIGMVLGDTLSFSGITLTNYQAPAPVPFSTTAQFTTSQGTFTFTSIGAQFGFLPAVPPFTTADSASISFGTRQEATPNFAPTTAFFAILFNASAYLNNTGVLSFPNGQFPAGYSLSSSTPLTAPYEGAAWILATVNSVPEPASACIWGLMGLGMLTYRRRWAR